MTTTGAPALTWRTPLRWTPLRRALTTALSTTVLLATGTAVAPSAWAAPTLVLDSLTVPAAAQPGQAIRGSARVHATGGTLALEEITIAVRDAGGAVLDLPGGRPATVTSQVHTYTSQTGAYPAGTYDVFVAYRAGGVWRDLAPHTTLRVAAPNPVTFASEFDGPAGGNANQGLARPVWTTDPCWSWATPCAGTMAQFRDANARLDGAGSLVLTATRSPDPGAMCGATACPFASARLTTVDWAAGGATRWSQTGGHFEARIRMPAGRGLWPAFWTVGDQQDSGWPDSGEIDVMELLGQTPRVVHQAAHSADLNRPAGTDRHVELSGGGEYTLPTGDVTSWHTYAVDWDAGASGYLKWSVDGVHIRTITAAQAGSLWEPFRHPQSLIVNLTVGGDWPGPPDASTAFPAKMYVDWIRVNRDPAI